MIRGLILYFIANVIGSLVKVWGFIFGLIVEGKDYLIDSAIAEDQNLNVQLRVILNKLLLKDNGEVSTVRFGDTADHTMSYVIGKNFIEEQLNKFGKFWYWFLYWVDKPARKYGGHCLVAVHHEERKNKANLLKINNN